MKTYILLLICLLSTLGLKAQELDHFNVLYEGEYKTTLVPMEYSNVDQKKTTSKSSSDHRIETFRYVPTNSDQFAEEVYTLYKKCFGSLSDEDKHTLREVEYVLLFDKEFRVYSYRIRIPLSLKDKLPLYEELLHQFGNECMKINMSPYVIVSYKDQFTGSNYPFHLFGIMRLQK